MNDKENYLKTKLNLEACSIVPNLSLKTFQNQAKFRELVYCLERVTKLSLGSS